MPQGHFAMRYRIPNVFTNNPNPTPTHPGSYGISLCSLTIYKPTPIPATSILLSILYLVYHTSYLPHLAFLRSVLRLIFTANVPSAPILVTLMMEELGSSETRFLQEPHGVTSQKTPFFIVTAVKTSNLT
jgi:hypothetical protein